MGVDSGSRKTSWCGSYLNENISHNYLCFRTVAVW